MGEHNNDGAFPEPPKKGIDLSKFEGLSNGEAVRTPNLAEVPIFKEVERIANAAKAMMPSCTTKDATNSISGIAAMAELGRASNHMDTMKKALGPIHKLEERIHSLTKQFSPESGIGKIAKQLQEQQRSIDALRPAQPFRGIEAPRRPDLHISPNPVHETNDRLERIEQRFEQILDVAANGAEIATGLQAHAADFLVKFENAASENDRSAARAIRLGAIAIVIALAMPVAQIFYTELWRVPQDSKAMQAVITEMQIEIATLRQTQIEAADRLAAALERSDRQTVEALQSIARSLIAPPPAPIEDPIAPE